MSAHAGQSDLIGWVDGMMATNPHIILTHGEDDARTVLAEKITSRYQKSPLLPYYGEQIKF